ncbi:MAG: hypothetical protein CMJ48_02375 [Planctomycetaceae bacterium]|nr:hypothetical protein [Planctomycetaceae bacterium]
MTFALVSSCLWATTTSVLAAERELPSIDKRFGAGDAKDTPSFQRHVAPLMGRLGCNGRACHGSFQGRGDFQLSLFGYDFGFDHKAITEGDEPRVDLDDPDESLIIAKPTSEDEHEGGQLYEKGSWQHRVMHGWVAAGAKYEQAETLNKLEIIPSEIVFAKAKQKINLKVVAVWPDGTREDVTPLCRFHSNSGQVATVDEAGKVLAQQPGDTHLVVSYDNAVVAVPVMRPVSKLVGKKYPKVVAPTPIDGFVVEKLRKLGIVPSEIAGDEEFLRRLSLDLTGTLPSPAEIEAFLNDDSPDKRPCKIDALLETPAYAAWWATRLCDFTGNSDTQLGNNTGSMNVRPSQEWYDWINKRVTENMPYDEIAAGIIMGRSRKPNQSYTEYCEEMSEHYRSGRSYADRDSLSHFWARRNFRSSEDRVIGFSYAFLGIRMQCAQCHKHPFDTWAKSDFEQFSGFLTRVTASNGPSRDAREEYNKIIEDLGLKGKRGNEQRREFAKLLKEGKTIPFPEVYVTQQAQRSRNNRNRPTPKSRLLGAEETTDLNELEDAREPLIEWLRAKDNPYFARAFVNRVWAGYFNVGIVEPPDDMSLANPPSNRPLLDYLAAAFVENGFDMKWLHREIANSHTYQRSWKPNDTNRSDATNFSHAVPRRLPAEVAYDAIRHATASDDVLAANRTNVEKRAIALAASGTRAGTAAYALTLFGRSTRETNCDCDRSSEASLLQTVYLKNDRDTLTLIDRRKEGWVDQMTRELKLVDKAKTRKRPKNYAQIVGNLEKTIARFKKADNKQQLRRQKQRLAQLIKQYGPVDQPETEMPEVDFSDFVRRTYLRTLSRYPTDTELADSTAYIQESEDKVSGIRGLLWALLNTKEFIVNH